MVNDGHQYGHNAHNLRVYKPRFGVAGDASGDGQITEADLTLLQQALNGQGTATMAMDCNQDGVVDNGDTPCIARQIGSNRNQGQGNGRGQGNGGGANGGPPPAPTTEPVQVGWVLFTHDEQGRLIGEYDEQGNPLRRYIWLNDTPVALIDAAGIHYIHTDHLNTPQAVTDSNGTVVWAADYAPFGEVTETVAELEMNLRFPGQYLDRETGLHQNWHREYDPMTGRYTQSDPIGLGGGLNLYLYANSDPISMVDISGLEAQPRRRSRNSRQPRPYHHPSEFNPNPGDHTLYTPATNCQCTLDCAEDAELLCNVFAPAVGGLIGGIVAAQFSAGFATTYGIAVGNIAGFTLCWLATYSICEHRCRDECNQVCSE